MQRLALRPIPAVSNGMARIRPEIIAIFSSPEKRSDISGHRPQNGLQSAGNRVSLESSSRWHARHPHDSNFNRSTHSPQRSHTPRRPLVTAPDRFVPYATASIPAIDNQTGMPMILRINGDHQLSFFAAVPPRCSCFHLLFGAEPSVTARRFSSHTSIYLAFRILACTLHPH